MPVNKDYDLEERLAKFAEKVIKTMQKIPQNAINSRMISQIVASAGSSGANYSEANEAESKKDFTHKANIVKKELKETKHWLRLLACANPDLKEEFRNLWRENHELLLIFSKIINSCRKKN
ncbi:four helix bundle protein [Candidatus Falkowbacteria bacterium CG23_combo_of_CG06-09_8_20_14_all_49_15]|uniref:Four helix bundle protein n=1 Tax=Candidatus Falkowbacteria bacterium CG23_combo_of_CG06-09_8_20_14_all_49_15 TaxID=1974572 RepID=A0A2G9ZM40_9BACT|nr:MAG: four helix bundle protein [Candidatus Falkowbacteria bacterium CG23_combo_of_CG06-09_8_20_14_all_49_15]